RDGACAVLLDARHRRAHMCRLEPYGDAAPARELAQAVRDLLCEPLLHGEATCIEPHETCELRDAENFVAGDIADVGAAMERERVVLAQGVEADGALDDLRVTPLHAFRPFGREHSAQLRIA